ncbi:MAG: polysaccharide deacetylase family protein [Clostridia bacterium]|nr:polysaccharide deacetylase family protein [Clostridia bacterium]
MKRTKKGGALFVNVSILLIAAFMYLALLSPIGVTELPQSRAHPVYRASSEDSVALIVAVPWEASALEGILDTLDKSGQTVTFAVSGRVAEAAPDILRRMAETGHEIATMGYAPEKDGDKSFIVSDLMRSVKAIEAASGEKPRFYYCGTRRAETSASAANSLGLFTVLPTIDLDCGSGTSFDIESRLVQNAFAGCIIGASPTAQFEESLPFLLESIKNMGLRIVHTHKMLYNHTDKL